MTTEHAMLNRSLRRLSAIASVCVLVITSACSTKQRYDSDPLILQSPYANQQDVIWAVAPFRNESGVSFADELRISDAMVSQIV